MEKIVGYVKHIVYQNSENGYTVLHVMAGGKEVTCVGNFQIISEGECVEIEGEYADHPSYGRQLKMKNCLVRPPQDRVSMERYLASGAVRGIGPALAARITQRFGEDTFRVIEDEPERLAEVKGISGRMAMSVSEQMEEKGEERQAMMYLQKYGVSPALSVKIYDAYGSDLYRVINENPYKMADDVSGVGFRTADEIARRVGVRADSDFRIRSGIVYVLLAASQEGHTCLPRDLLTARACELLGVEEEAVERHYTDMAVEKKIVMKRTGDHVWVYASFYYHKEASVAVMLRELNVRYDIPESEITQKIRESEKLSDIELDELQLAAVRESVSNGLLVITGGPGTGKTTTINAIIRYFESEDRDICLAAPTGRAAKRMSETTGCEARTIHRMLELSGGEGEQAGFERNEEKPLEADVIIIDEVSMVDINLMCSLLKAVVVGTRLILVGDVDQLPSVGPGSVLRDIIDAHACNVVRLHRVFRQASKSDIIVNAHRINRGEDVPLDNNSMDFFFLKREDANVIISICIRLVREKMPGFVDARPFDIQVLTPTRKGLLGVERLNGILQQYLNPPSDKKAEKECGGTVFRVGDKVMQTKNDYQTEWQVLNRHGIQREEGRGVFNGDMGVIKEINAFAETLTVEFDEGRRVVYPFGRLDNLDLSYAITIHKAQGSEYPAVVIPLLRVPRMLNNRNLLYTAVTRAKKCVTLVGDEGTFFSMVRNVSEQKRYTGLRERLEEL